MMMNDMEIKKGIGVSEEDVEIFKRLRMKIECNAIELSRSTEEWHSLMYVKGIHKGIEIRDADGDIDVKILAVHEEGTVVFETVGLEESQMFSILPNKQILSGQNPVKAMMDKLLGGQGEMVACGMIDENGKIVAMDGNIPDDIRDKIPEFSDMLGEDGGIIEGEGDGVVECPYCGNFVAYGKKCIFCNGEK